jgi:hypothetical protein
VNGSGVANVTCGYGPGGLTMPVPSPGTDPYMFSGPDQPPKPHNDISPSGGTETEVIAVMYANGLYYGIGFTG